MVINNLAKRGFVSREKHPNDSRAMATSLTEEGEMFIKDFFPKHLERIVDEFSTLTPEELIELGRLSKKVGEKEK